MSNNKSNNIYSKMRSILNILCCSIMLFYCGCKPDVHLSGDDTVLCEVDLGLSVKWANMNLGAEKPEEFGKYYALGDVQPYDSVPNTIDLPVNDFEWHDSLGVVFPNYDAASNELSTPS